MIPYVLHLVLANGEEVSRLVLSQFSLSFAAIHTGHSYHVNNRLRLLA
jgi:hypothetical protein